MWCMLFGIGELLWGQVEYLRSVPLSFACLHCPRSYSLLAFIACLYCLPTLLVFNVYLHCLPWLLSLIALLDCLPSLFAFIACLHCLPSLLTFIACLHCLPSLFSFIACLPLLFAFIACLHCLPSLFSFIACLYCLPSLLAFGAYWHLYLWVCSHDFHVACRWLSAFQTRSFRKVWRSELQMSTLTSMLWVVAMIYRNKDGSYGCGE